MSNEHEDFEEPDFEHDNYDEDFEEHEHEEEEEPKKTKKSSSGSGSNLKKFAIPAVAVVAILGLVVEGGNIKNMIMGTSSNVPVHHLQKPLPHNMGIHTPLEQNNVSEGQNSSLPSVQIPSVIPPTSQPPLLNTSQSPTPPITQTTNTEIHTPTIPLNSSTNNIPNVSKGSDNSANSANSDLINSINNLTATDEKVVDGQQDIKQSVNEGLKGLTEHVDQHMDDNTQALTTKIEALTKVTNDMSAKIDSLNKPSISNTNPISSGIHHPIVHKAHKVHHIKIVKPVINTDVPHPESTFSDYHLVSISKTGAVIVDKDNKYTKVQLGTTPEGHIGNVTGTIQGIGKTDTGTWYLQTPNGKIGE